MVCLFFSGLNNIIHWKAHLLIISRSEFSRVAESLLCLTLEKSDVSFEKQ